MYAQAQPMGGQPYAAGQPYQPGPTAQDYRDIQNGFAAAAQAVNDAMNGWDQQQYQQAPQYNYAQQTQQAQYAPPPSGYGQQAAPQSQPSQDDVNNAKNFLGNFVDYLKNGGFKRDIDCTSQQYGVPPKKLAENFLEKCLGTVGDILGIAFTTVGNAAHTLVDILSTIAHGAVNIVVRVANGLASFVTLNKTCVAQ